MAISRVVIPELLDGLHPDDPEARRSRRDLRLINALMGNAGWVVGGVTGARQIVEIGAGDGGLCRKLSATFPGSRVLGVDLAERPAELPDEISWQCGDLFAELPKHPADALVGVMILHHFTDDRLGELGRLFENFRTLCFCEPWRAALPRLFGRLMFPLVGRVTRHDMPVSINAGFRRGELPELLGLENWNVKESVDWRGSVRLLAWRR